MQDPEQLIEKDKALTLLADVFGPMKEGSRVESMEYSLRDMAHQLGYDDSQLSRILNPPVGTEKSADTYRRLSQRLNLIKSAEENERLIKTAEEHKSLVKNYRRLTLLLAGFTILLAGCLFYSFSTVKTAETNHLTAEEMESLTDLYNDYIKASLVAEALLFNGAVKEGLYEQPEYSGQLNSLRERIQNTISEGRSNLKGVQLYTPNGYELSALFEKFNENKLDKNLADVIPFLLDKTIPSSALEKEIAEKMTNIQNRNKVVFDSVAALVSLSK
jgi:CTP-dependent riboflavin kinase